ncbi:MAG: site-specific integrase [Parabacteroides sp.]
MATIENRISKRVDKNGKSQIIVKLTITPHNRPCFKSGVFVKPEWFRSVKESGHGKTMEIVPPKKSRLQSDDNNEALKAKSKLSDFSNRILKICQVAEDKKEIVTKEYVEKALLITSNILTEDITHIYISENSGKDSEINVSKQAFFELMEEYKETSKKKNDYNKSDVWRKNFDVLIRVLHRYEAFRRLSDAKDKDYTLDINTISGETLKDIENYLRNEHTLYDKYPNIFREFPANIDKKKKDKKPQQRGNNTICALFNKLRAFFHWCEDKTNNRPFYSYTGITAEKYGTPIYLSLDERNQIAEYDLSKSPELAIQRDVFIFQCLIGCRVGDLLKMTEKNIINDAIEYIPNKTADENPLTVRVPLNDRAKTIVERYKGNKTLLPFISAQKYNDDIKKIFLKCGITRMVTALNPVTGKAEQKPINEVASSHMARRTFIGNLYKQVKDPNLVGTLSGHVEGSKAFARYRDIDEGIKKDLVKLID